MDRLELTDDVDRTETKDGSREPTSGFNRSISSKRKVDDDLDDLVIGIETLELSQENDRKEMVEITIELARLNLTEFEAENDLARTATKLEDNDSLCCGRDIPSREASTIHQAKRIRYQEDISWICSGLNLMGLSDSVTHTINKVGQPENETIEDGMEKVNLLDDTNNCIEDPDVSNRGVFDTTTMVVVGRNIFLPVNNPTKLSCTDQKDFNRMELTSNMMVEKTTEMAQESSSLRKDDQGVTASSSTGGSQARKSEGRDEIPLQVHRASTIPRNTESKAMKYNYKNDVMTIPEEGMKANMMTGDQGKYLVKVVEPGAISSEVQKNTHTTAAKTKQLKARQWVKLRSGLYGWKVKVMKGKPSSTNNSPAPNSAKQRPIVTTQTNPIQKISNYFSKSSHTSDIVAGNIRGLSAFRVQGSEGQHGLSEQQQPED